MLAIVADPTTPRGYGFAEVPESAPQPHQAIVRILATSLNRGELTTLARRSPGDPLGFDFAGTVLEPAGDGSGPPAGTRVFGVAPAAGTWRERDVIATSALTILPDAVSFARGASLGVAGLTALYSLRYGGLLLGRRVIVTGATGGVGRIAVQLAAMAGAETIAIVRDASRTASLKSLDLPDLTFEVGLQPSGVRADLIVESVGGETLSTAFRRVAVGGTIIMLGRSSSATPTLPPDWFYRNATLHGVDYFHDMAADASAAQVPAALIRLVAQGRLDPGLSLQVDWQDIDAAADALLGREVTGKVALTISDEGRN